MSARPPVPEIPPVLTGLALSARAAATLPRGASRSVAWSPLAPALPAELADAVDRVWGVRVSVGDNAPDPRRFPAFAALYAAARTEQLLRTLAGRTNLTLAAAHVLVVGDGVVAEAIARSLRRLGGVVTVASDDPHHRLRAVLGGLPAFGLEAALALGSDITIATGEGHPPLALSRLRGLAADASADGRGLEASGAPASEARPGVQSFGEAWIVAVPPPIPHSFDAASAVDRRIADALVALSLLVAADGADPDGADPAVVDPARLDAPLARWAA